MEQELTQVWESLGKEEPQGDPGGTGKWHQPALLQPGAGSCQSGGRDGQVGEQPTEAVSLCLAVGLVWLWLCRAHTAGKSKEKPEPLAFSFFFFFCLLSF